MKKLFALTLVLLMLLSLTACGKMAGEEEIEQETPKTTVYLPETIRFSLHDKDRAENFKRSYSYDKYGRCISCTQTGMDANGVKYEQQLDLVYDKVGNVVQETFTRKSNHGDAAWESVSETLYEYTYDKSNRATRLVVTQIYNGAAGEPEIYDLAYDEKGNLTQVIHDILAYYYEYDANGRLAAEYYAYISYAGPTPDSTTYRYVSTTYTHDKQGNVTNIDYASAVSPDLVPYDKLDTLTFKEDLDIILYYDDQGRLTGVNDPDEYHYDENGHLIRPEETHTIKDRGQEVEQLLARYTCDAHGNVSLFESYNRTDEYTYVELELTKEDAEYAQRQFRLNRMLDQYFDTLYSIDTRYPQYHHLFSLFPAHYHMIPNLIW